MVKNKLKKFSQLKEYNHVLEPSIDDLDDDFYLKGKWRSDFFKNKNPIVLELGCGKGEYSVGLAKRYPNKNFIGIDIKGARIWKGATDSLQDNISNVGFLRTRIEWIEKCFSVDEIDEIWITFPDPQIKSRRGKKRLTHPIFLHRYNNILRKKGRIHLKTDSQFLYGFTLGVISAEQHLLEYSNSDVHAAQVNLQHMDIKTHYENIFLDKGSSITYIVFSLNY